MIPKIAILGQDFGRYGQFSLKIVIFYHFLQREQSISQLKTNLESYS